MTTPTGQSTQPIGFTIDRPAEVEPPELLDPTRVYHLEGIIGEGSFAHIYRARCIQDGWTRTVAVKVLMKRRFTEQLWREGRILASIVHHGIPRVEGRLYIYGYPVLVMEYIPGVPLSWLVKEHTVLPPGLALEIVARMASALDEVHGRLDDEGKPAPIVHCDVKPANIVLTPHGGVKLVDFGSARPPATDLKGDFGSHMYLAPERFQREARPESDIYALGAVLCEMLTGQAPLPVDWYPYVPTSVYPQVRKRIDASRLPQAHALYDLIIWLLGDENGARPSAVEVEDACREIRLRIGGPSLAEWARRYVRPLHPRELAPLVGVTVREPAPPTQVQQFQYWYRSFIERLLPIRRRKR